MVTHRQRLLLLINSYAYSRVTQVTFHLAHGRQGLQFTRRIHRITDQLTQEDLMIGIQKFLDDREYIITRHPNITFTHIVLILII